MSNTLISFKKELKAIFRDKKFLSIILLMPLIIPGFIIMFGGLYDSMLESDGFEIGVNYEMAAEEKAIFESTFKDITFVNKTEEELKEDFDNKEIQAYITKNEDTYILNVDTTESTGMQLREMIGSCYTQYNQYLGTTYVVENGLDPEKAYNSVKMEVNELNAQGQDYFSNFIISFALIYLVMIVTITAMNTSTDLIAGEKERGTFETILTFPLKSTEIIGGKLLAIVFSCVVSSLIGICTSIPAFMYIKKHSETFANLNLTIDVKTILLAIVTLILISTMVGVISLFLTGRAKTFKEAQSKTSFLSFLSLIPMFTNLMNVSNEVLYIIPVANGGTVLNDLFLKGISLKNMLLFVGSSLIVTGIVLFIVGKQYKDEKALF